MICSELQFGVLGKHARIFADPVVVCDHKHELFACLPLLVHPNVHSCAAYYGCNHNERVALSHRHALPTPDVQFDAFWPEAFRLFRTFFPVKKLRKHTQESVIARAPMGKRKLVENAFATLNRDGLQRNHLMAKSFIKFEKAVDSPDDPPERKPARLIQGPNPVKTYHSGQWFNAVEDYLFRRSCDSDPRVFFAKGMTPGQVAKVLLKMEKMQWAILVNGDDSVVRYKGKWYLFDHSKYDGTLVNPIREHAWQYYWDLFHDWELEVIFNSQRVNWCRSKSGILYRIFGTMLSGEKDTSLTDCVCNMAYLLRLVFSGMDLTLLNKSGFVTKLQIVETFEEVEFCQAHPVQYMPGKWTMCPNPWRVMSRAPYTIHHRGKAENYRGLVGASAMSMLWQCSGMPIMQEYALAMLRASCGKIDKRELYDLTHYSGLKQQRERPVRPEARESFCLAYGVAPSEQLSIESALRFAKFEVRKVHPVH